MAEKRLFTVLHHLRSLLPPASPEGVADGELLRRFVATGDEAAFELLLRRHGALVLSVCRRLLCEPHDAEDAFQATFLVLVRKARSIVKRESVASWLYGVAYRIAFRARADAARRAARHVPLDAGMATTHEETARAEVLGVLDQEINRLPEKYRTPLLLCCLEGVPRAAAARALGWSLGRLKGRLERGRERLRGQLARRGLTLSVTTLAGLLASGASAAPASLSLAILRSARPLAPGGSASHVSPRVASHVEGALRTMRLTRWKWTAALVLAVSLVGAGAVWFPRGSAAVGGAAQALRPSDDGSQARPEDQQPGKTELRVKDLVFALAFSPKGGTLASCDGKTIRLWDVATGKELRQFQGSAHFVAALAFTPDGKTLASAGFGPQVQLWDAANGKKIRQFDAHPDQVGFLAFSPDGKTLVTAGGERSRRKPGGQISRPEDVAVRVWDPATGKELSAFKDGIVGAFGPAFAPDGKTLATAGPGNAVRLWEVATGKEVLHFAASNHPTTRVVRVGYSPDGKVLAAAINRAIRLCEADTGKEIRTLNPDPGDGSPGSQVLTGFAFSRDGKLLAAGAEDGTVVLWEVETGKALPRLSGHTAFLAALAFAPDGKTLATGSHDRTIRLWDLKTRKQR